MEEIKERLEECKNKKADLNKLFGVHKFSKPTEELMKEMGEELYDN